MSTNILLTVHLILPFCCRLSSSNSEKAESSSRGFILCGDKYGTYEWKKKKKRSLSKSLHIIFVCRWFRRFFLYGHSTKNLQHKMWKRSNLSSKATIEVKNGRKFLQSVWTRLCGVAQFSSFGKMQVELKSRKKFLFVNTIRSVGSGI